MSDLSVDVCVLGAGFGGSLMATVLSRCGLTTALIDKATHPRFAIGESSTPIANLVLGDLAREYDLPELNPLTKYGTWQATHPELVCGIKRGFSYFKHEQNCDFHSTKAHSNELLVAASSDDQHSDTHWLRSDIDTFLVEQAQAAAVAYFDSTDVTLSQHDQGWTIHGTRNSETLHIDAKFVVDASGAAGVLSQHLGLADSSDSIQTRSRAIFGHFEGVLPFDDYLNGNEGGTADHPFNCDNAAQHHILDDAWMWLLRFNNGLTSAGVVLDEGKHPFDDSSPHVEWDWLFERYPTLGRLFAGASIVNPSGELMRTSRLQRRVVQLVGTNWALLPNTAGFVDPLHSTGIAHTLCGIEKLARILRDYWEQSSLTEQLRSYQSTVAEELSLIDELVFGCFQSFRNFRLFVAYSMLYFAAATTFERRRLNDQGNSEAAFLCADDPSFREVVSTTLGRMQLLIKQETVSTDDAREFEEFVSASIAPFNSAGLCDPSIHNMYRHTALPVSNTEC